MGVSERSIVLLFWSKDNLPELSLSFHYVCVCVLWL